MNIALIGYGKMGKEIERLASERHVSVKKFFTSANNKNGKGLTKQSLKDIDVCIEITSPNAVMNNILAAAACKKNIVVGTTGWYDKLDDVKKIVRKSNIGLLYASNFSLGMNIFQRILSSASDMFDSFDAYDVAISETHHKKKIDRPSGTALALGKNILQHISRKKSLRLVTANGNTKPGELRITSKRIGNIVGEHRVVFVSDADSIELVHTAKNRRGFALGALFAAEWLKGKKGVYTMNDALTSIL